MALLPDHKFMPSSPDGKVMKRKQVPRACNMCRKQKKRCTHGSDYDSIDRTMEPDPTTTEARRRRCATNTNDTNSNGAESEIGNSSKRQRTGESRYIGHLNPEAEFLQNAQGDLAAGRTQADHIGVWQSQPRLQDDSTELSSGAYKSDIFKNIYIPNEEVKTFLPQIHTQCAMLLPPPQHLEELEALYWNQMNPILPVLNYVDFKRLPVESEKRRVLSQALCLVTSFSPQAKKSLYLNAVSEELLGPRDFAGHLHYAVQTQLSLGVFKDTFLVVQLSTLLALCTYFARDRGDPADLCARAVTSMFTLGLHLEIPDLEKNRHNETLFCCVWALDRLNAAFLGRPLMIHHRDLGKDIKNCADRQESSFRIFLYTVLELDSVIDMYRPNPEKRDPGQIASFGLLLQSCGGSRDVGSSAIATIELLYHAMSILSYRENASNSASPRSGWRQFSALSVRSYAYEKLTSVHWFPWVPYAVLHSLRVSYRMFHSSNEPYVVDQAKEEMSVCYGMLDNLSVSFASVLSIASFASRIVAASEHRASKRIEARREPERRAQEEPDEAGQSQRAIRDPATPTSNEDDKLARHIMVAETSGSIDELGDDIDLAPFKLFLLDHAFGSESTDIIFPVD